MSFPRTRMRRMRRSPALRAMIRETDLSAAQLIQPMFVVAGEGVREEVPSMPGSTAFDLRVCSRSGPCRRTGVPAVLLFGIPARRR